MYDIDRKPSEETGESSCSILGQSTCLFPVARFIDTLWNFTGKLYSGNRAETVTDLAVSDEVVMIGRKASVHECTTAIKNILFAWVQEDDCGGGGGGANPFILLYVMLKK